MLKLVLVNLFRVLESTKTLIDGIAKETPPLLSEVTTTVTSVNTNLVQVAGASCARVHKTTWVRFLALIFFMMRRRCTFTVASAMPILCAITLLLWPRPSSVRTSCSRGVK